MDLIASAGMRNLDWAAHMRIDRFLRSCSVNHEPPFYKARAGQARQVTRG